LADSQEALSSMNLVLFIVMTAEITRHHKNKLREGPSTNIG
jgi:hypothetical protein